MPAKAKRKSKTKEPTDKRVLDLQQQRLVVRHEFGGKLAEMNRQILHLRQSYGDKLSVLDAAIAAAKDGKPIPPTPAAPLPAMINGAPVPASPTAPAAPEDRVQLKGPPLPRDSNFTITKAA